MSDFVCLALGLGLIAAMTLYAKMLVRA